MTNGNLREIRLDDIPESYRDIAEKMGIDNFINLCELCGGITLYLPKVETLKLGGRDREIRSRFDGGNYKMLARQFRLSERQIRKIINGYRN